MEFAAVEILLQEADAAKTYSRTISPSGVLPRLEQALQLCGRPALERRVKRTMHRPGYIDNLLRRLRIIGLDQQFAALRSAASGREPNHNRETGTRPDFRREWIVGDLEGRAALIAVIVVMMVVTVLPLLVVSVPALAAVAIAVVAIMASRLPRIRQERD